MPTTNATIAFKGVKYETWAKDQKRRENWAAGNQMLTTVANTGISITNMALNFALMKHQYNAMREGMKYQYKLGLAGINLELNKNSTMQNIQEDNNRTSLKIAKLSANMQVKLARVSQQGRTDRAKIYVSHNTLHGQAQANALRSNYFYG
jgi:hypothetical protein